MNHRWQDNTCINCGITRERRECQKLVNTRSVLSRHGVFYDVPVYQYGTGWWYGEKDKFKRPECKTKNQIICQKKN